MEEFEKLKELIKRIRRNKDVCNMFYWDMETLMPIGARDLHVDTFNHFERKVFNLETAEELKETLVALCREENFKELNPTWQFIVKRMLYKLERNEKIPKNIVNANIQVTTRSKFNWKRAKKNKDFSLFSDDLENLIELKKVMYGYTDPDKDIYDAMINEYEEGMDSDTLDRLFFELKSELVPLLKEVLEKEKSRPKSLIDSQKYSIDGQRKAQEIVLRYIGFDYSKGTVGETEHPFTMSFNSNDVRLTNHFYANNLLSGLFTAIHEGGHAIFEQNVNPEYDNTVAGSCDNMGLHESQSRFYENVLGRRKSFWVPIYGYIQEVLPELKSISLDDFSKELTRVKNDYIRMDADELTYCLHIILRYDLEKAIFRDNVPVSTLPDLWNKKMEEYLFIVPRNDEEGLLQDGHWASGSFGYFPSYLLGSIYDGMLLEQIEEELGDVDEILKKGEILKITKWLNEKIHVYGNTKTPAEIIKEVCHKELSAAPLIRYFKKRYL